MAAVVLNPPFSMPTRVRASSVLTCIDCGAAIHELDSWVCVECGEGPYCEDCFNRHEEECQPDSGPFG